MTFARVLVVAVLLPVAAYLALCAYVFAAQLFPRATASFPAEYGHDDLPDTLVVQELAALVAVSR